MPLAEHSLPVDTQPLISTVAAVYNVEDYIERYLKSLSDNAIDKSVVEIAIVDDASVEVYEAFYTVHWDHVRLLLNTGLIISDLITRRTLVLHLSQ